MDDFCVTLDKVRRCLSEEGGKDGLVSNVGRVWKRQVEKVPGDLRRVGSIRGVSRVCEGSLLYLLFRVVPSERWNRIRRDLSHSFDDASKA